MYLFAYSWPTLADTFSVSGEHIPPILVPNTAASYYTNICRTNCWYTIKFSANCWYTQSNFPQTAGTHSQICRKTAGTHGQICRKTAGTHGQICHKLQVHTVRFAGTRCANGCIT